MNPIQSGANAAQVDHMAARLFEMGEQMVHAQQVEDGLEEPDYEPGTWSGDLDEDDREQFRTVIRKLIEEGVLAPGHAIRETPTTSGMVVVAPPDPIGEATAESMLRASRSMIEELRTAVIAARELAKMVRENGADYPTMDAADRWRDRFGMLAEPLMEIEVEDDEDPEGTPVEGALWVKEEGP